jgi:hypothetical protein
MSNKYLTKLAALPGVGIVRPLENLVKRTKQVSTGLANRERAVSQGLSNKPLAAPTAKLQALKTQSDKKMWTT